MRANRKQNRKHFVLVRNLNSAMSPSVLNFVRSSGLKLLTKEGRGLNFQV